MKLIYRQSDSASPAVLGGKAGALARLNGTGLAIPPWFVVPSPANGSLKVLPPELLAVLPSAMSEICPAGQLLAVRSSAKEEDGSEFSFAGQFESHLCVRPEDVAAKIIEVWQSGSSPRAQAYRKLHGLSHDLTGPAVLVQRMVTAEVSGVAFGADPVTGRPDVAVIAAVAGAGSALVGGESDADTWHVDANGRISQRQVVTPGGPVLDEKAVCEVATLVRRVGAIFGRPQDVEWARAGGRLFLLQARPITARGTTAAGELNIWDNSNITESYCGVTTPLTFSFARRAYEGVYREFCVLLSVRRDKIAAHDQTYRELLGLVRGRVYYNLLNWYRILSLLPGFTVNRRFMEQMMGVKEALPEEIVAELGQAGVGARLRDALDLVRMGGALCLNHFLLPRKIRQFRARLEAALEPPERPLEAMDAAALGAYFLALQGRLLKRWDAPLLNDFLAMIFHGLLRKLAVSWLGDAGAANTLLCGGGGMISAEPARRVRRLATLAAADPLFVEQLCEAPLPEIRAALARHPAFEWEFTEYLEKFGERCLEELKLESLTHGEDPRFLLRCIGQIARHGDGKSTGGSEPETAPRNEAEQQMERALAGHPFRRLVFGWILKQARAKVRDRENLRFERTRLFGRVRRVFVQLGHRLHAQGWLAEPRDVFYLEIAELLGAADGTGEPERLREVVAQRQAEFDEYRTTAPPPGRFETRGNANRNVPAAPASGPATPAGDTRQGLGCCPGVVRGRVRLVTDPRTATIQRGDIIVAERTDPGWVVLFPAASGLLVERGSLLSHSAIVARELGLPAVVSIPGLCAWLRDGDEVEFDGATGSIRRFTPEPAARPAAKLSTLEEPCLATPHIP
jgi:phosphohistidine swiveling domain-containing protein